jgi:hypothetical protein
MVLSLAKVSNLGIAFFLEIGTLTSVIYWGFIIGPTLPLKLLLALSATALAILVWALFGAPKATWHLDGVWRVLLQVLFFGSAVLALYAANQYSLSLIFALVALISCTMARIWNQ